ncbi:MAG: NIL domain-containing protein [Actinobacteria bacterium]|nr:NIL domain-containing protein [Actinomycetota bacterium]
MGVKVRLTFPEELIRQPLLARMVQAYFLLPNIRRASVDDHEGWIICEIDGEAEAVEKSLSWLTSQGVKVDALGDLIEG